MSDVDKAVPDFDPVYTNKETDIEYIIRTTLEGRDKYAFTLVKKSRDREALEEVFGKASVISQDPFTITGNSDAEFSSDIGITALFRHVFESTYSIPVLYTIESFTDVALSSGNPVTGGTTNYLFARFDPVVGVDGFTLHSTITEPTNDTDVILATYTATGAAGSFVITVTDIYPNGSLDKDFEEGNNGTETAPDSFFGRMGKKLIELNIIGAVIGYFTTVSATEVIAERIQTPAVNISRPDIFTQVGSSFSLNMNRPSITSLSSTDIAFIDFSNAELRTYRFNGSTWSQIGSGLSVAGNSLASISALSSTDIAFVDSGITELRTYRFNGSVWAQIGSGLSVNDAKLCTLSSTDVALVDVTADELRTYRFNGSVWAQIGSSLSLGGNIDNTNVCALSSTDIAFIDGALNTLRTYRFNGSTWSQIGSGLSLASLSASSITTLSSTDVALADAGSGTIAVYNFNGSVWEKVSNDLTPAGMTEPDITTLAYNTIAFTDSGVDEIITYELSYIDPPPNTAFGTL